MSHVIFGVRANDWSDCGERGTRQRAWPPKSVPDTRRESELKREGDPRGTSLGEVLSCRIFDLGKGAQRTEILVDRMTSAAPAEETRTKDSKACQRRFGESQKGSRKALNLGRSMQRHNCRHGLVRGHFVGKRMLGRSMVDVWSASFGLPEADAESRLSRTLRANLGINLAGWKHREVFESNSRASLTVDPLSQMAWQSVARP